jgi:hypothetical protein
VAVGGGLAIDGLTQFQVTDDRARAQVKIFVAIFLFYLVTFMGLMRHDVEITFKCAKSI